MTEIHRTSAVSASTRGLHVVAKPAGPACNLNCAYCFYLEKSALYGNRRNYRMTDDVLARYTRNYVESQPTPAVEFVWQGGEPTLLGIDFFRRVVELQQPYTEKKAITNVLQTNGTLLDDKWCRFLRRHEFLVGISLDGPAEIHDRYRRDKRGRGSFAKVYKGLQLLKEHGVRYNIMASVARETAKNPLSVYEFFRHEEVKFIQFTPVVERVPGAHEKSNGLRLAGPGPAESDNSRPVMTSWSVLPEEYGDFLISIYEEWVRHDVGETFIMNFEWALNAWVANPSPVCIHSQRCGQSLVIEHNGDIYACDHYVYPQYQLGNICNRSLAAMVEIASTMGIGSSKENDLDNVCRECAVLAACQGGCPKQRFVTKADGRAGRNYLCAGYRKFFLHIRKYLRVMAALLENGYPASMVMEAIKGPLLIQAKYMD